MWGQVASDVGEQLSDASKAVAKATPGITEDLIDMSKRGGTWVASASKSAFEVETLCPPTAPRRACVWPFFHHSAVRASHCHSSHQQPVRVSLRRREHPGSTQELASFV